VAAILENEQGPGLESERRLVMGRSEPPRVAVCVLRVESRGETGVLITVTTTSDVRAGAPGRTRSVAAADEALQLVAGFLDECGQNQSPRH
jgi:hypothetical protein